MAILKGYNGSLTAGGDIVGEVKNWNATTTADVVDVTVLGSDGWGANCPTIKRWTASFSVHIDVGDLGQTAVDTALAAGGDLALVLFAGGNSGAGNRSYTGNAVVDSYAIVNDVAGIVEATVSVTGNGALTPADLA